MEDRVEEQLTEFYREVRRRDRWILNAVWNVLRSLNSAINGVMVVGVLIFNGWTQWWQWLAAMAGVGVFNIWNGSRLSRLEEDDDKKIERDAVFWRPEP